MRKELDDWAGKDRRPHEGLETCKTVRKAKGASKEMNRIVHGAVLHNNALFLVLLRTHLLFKGHAPLTFLRCVGPELVTPCTSALTSFGSRFLFLVFAIADHVASTQSDGGFTEDVTRIRSHIFAAASNSSTVLLQQKKVIEQP